MSAAFTLVFDGPRDPGEGLVPLPVDEETALVTAAQQGDNAAMRSLLVQYRHALRARLADRIKAGDDREDAGSDILFAFTEALHMVQPGERVAKYLGTMVTRITYDDRLGDRPLGIPGRTLRKVSAALAEAHDDVNAALAIVRSHEDSRDRVSEETFRAAIWALRLASGETTVEATAGEVDPIGDLEATLDARIDVATAFAAVDERTVAVCRHSYGFEDFDRVSDEEVAHRLGLTRSTVQRVRAKGLVDMHDALCDDHGVDERCNRPDRHYTPTIAALAPEALDAWAERLDEAEAA